MRSQTQLRRPTLRQRASLTAGAERAWPGRRDPQQPTRILAARAAERDSTVRSPVVQVEDERAFVPTLGGSSFLKAALYNFSGIGVGSGGFASRGSCNGQALRASNPRPRPGLFRQLLGPLLITQMPWSPFSIAAIRRFGRTWGTRAMANHLSCNCVGATGDRHTCAQTPDGEETVVDSACMPRFWATSPSNDNLGQRM